MSAKQENPPKNNRSKAGTPPSSPRRSPEDATYLTLHVLTWNVSGNIPALHDIQSLFMPQEGLGMRKITEEADILVLGLQEAYPNVGEAVASALPLIGRDPLVDNFSVVLGKSGYARVTFCRLLGILIIVFVKRALLCYISDVSTSSYRTGVGGLWGNKGAACVRFVLGDTSVVFANCHLVPHLENNERRVEELGDIIRYVSFTSSFHPPLSILEHDIVVLFGDLNFRLKDRDFDDVVQLLDHKEHDFLINKLDQLMLEQIKGRKSPSFLYKFMEMPICFEPSYKYEPGTDNYHDGGKGRAPAWTDRVLWHINPRRLPQPSDVEPKLIVKPSYYALHNQPRISDHKAVSCSLKLLINLSSNPRVMFVLSEWICGSQGTLEFDIAYKTIINSWDWVGLYHEDFISVDKDALYWTYTPAVSGIATQVTSYSKPLPSEKVPMSPGRYVLVYWSNHYKCVLGMSPLFRISLEEIVNVTGREETGVDMLAS